MNNFCNGEGVGNKKFANPHAFVMTKTWQIISARSHALHELVSF